jgi:hypothetical protein
MRTWPALLLIAMLATGCGTLPPPAPSERLPDDQVGAISTQILLVGDTQEHNITGLPILLLSGLVDQHIAAVTIRPPQQALFGRKLYEFLGAQASAAKIPIVHMGDIVDHSCVDEFERIISLAKHIEAPVAFAPGNHDGLFQGIFNRADNEQKSTLSAWSWDYVCRHPEETESKDTQSRNDEAPWKISDEPGVPTTPHLLSKDEFIQRYLNFLEDRYTPPKRPGLQPCHNSLAPYCRESVGFHTGIYAKIIKREPHCTLVEGCPNFSTSFLVQILRLSNPDSPKQFRLLLIDTTQPAAEFRADANSLSLSPGDKGYLQDDQLKLIEQLAVREAAQGHIVVFGGHHPWNRLERRARARLSEIFQKLNQAPIYLSAHTHRGFWAKHPLKAGMLLEFNQSSLADWPIDARRVHFELSRDQSKLGLVAIPEIGRDATDDASLLQAWRQALCETDSTGMSTRVLDNHLQQQTRIAAQHHLDGATLWDTLSVSLAYWFMSTERWKHHLYVDNINDNRKALLSFAALLDHSQPTREWMKNWEKDRAKAHQPTLWIPQSCMQNADLSDRLRCAANLQPRKSTSNIFGDLARSVSLAQAAISEASISAHPKVARIMACTHVHAAYHDWHENNRSEGTLTPAFFQTQAINAHSPEAHNP